MLLNNRYQVMRLLGEGGFGKTFLAQDTQMPSQRSCVIKQLKPITIDPAIYQLVQARFQQEAAVLETLGEESDQIPQLYAYFSEDGLFYLVQEWVEGVTLDRLVQTQGIASESAVQQILLSLLPVLAIVHQRNIIHRDIKPENIILRQRDQKPVLIDFGAVRQVVGTVVTAGGTPQSSIIIGTPGFMPSEQAIGRPIPASDLYSLGLTAIYLLTGKSPQQLSTDAQTGDIIWQEHAPSLSPKFAVILDKAIRSHPRDRYSSVTEMLTALRQLVQPQPGSIAATAVPSISTLPSTILPQTSEIGTRSEMGTKMVAPSQPVAVNSQSHQHRSPILLGSLLVGGLIGSAILVGFFLIRSPLSGQTSLSSPSSSPNQTPISSPIPEIPASPTTDNTTVSPPPISANPSPEYTSENSQENSSVTSPSVEPDSQPIATQTLILKTASTNNQINIYDWPSLQANSPSYGLNGDRVIALRQTQGEEGSLWYFVRFELGAEGWVRSDFIQSSNAESGSESESDRNTISFPQAATLTGSTPGSRVNVRSAPSTQADSPHYGLVGDRVTVLSQTQNAEGTLWYQVQFESGAEGWVRSDFVQVE